MPGPMLDMREVASHLPRVCEALRAADPDIVAIVQFGSSVYMPDVAGDVDLLVVSKQRKDSAYWDATADIPVPLDVIPYEAGRKVEPHLAQGIRAASELLYGDAELVRRMVTEIPAPTYDEARSVIRAGDDALQLAATTSKPVVRETHRRNSLNTLFDAARLAVMAFLDAEQTRWGQLRSELPAPFDERFRAIIHNLHKDIFYERALPLVGVEEEYQEWRQRVLDFINDLEQARG